MDLYLTGSEIAIWLPPLVGLVLPFFCSLGGVSGAILLLPFQLSVLGFSSPAVSALCFLTGPSGIEEAILVG